MQTLTDYDFYDLDKVGDARVSELQALAVIGDLPERLTPSEFAWLNWPGDNSESERKRRLCYSAICVGLLREDLEPVCSVASMEKLSARDAALADAGRRYFNPKRVPRYVIDLDDPDAGPQFLESDFDVLVCTHDLITWGADKPGLLGLVPEVKAKQRTGRPVGGKPVTGLESQAKRTADELRAGLAAGSELAVGRVSSALPKFTAPMQRYVEGASQLQIPSHIQDMEFPKVERRPYSDDELEKIAARLHALNEGHSESDHGIDQPVKQSQRGPQLGTVKKVLWALTKAEPDVSLERDQMILRIAEALHERGITHHKPGLYGALRQWAEIHKLVFPDRKTFDKIIELALSGAGKK